MSALALAASSLAGGQTSEQIAKVAASPGQRAPMVDFEPGLDDLMTMLIQPRHIKLYHAGTADNWELAAFELAELRSAFRRTAQTIPRYQGNDVNSTLQTYMEPRLQAVDAAIKTGNAKQFVKEYALLTAACNACHTYLERPFLVIEVPDAAARSAYADQNLAK